MRGLNGNVLGVGEGVFEEAFWLKLLRCNKKEQPQPVYLSHPSPSWNVDTISGGVAAIL